MRHHTSVLTVGHFGWLILYSYGSKTLVPNQLWSLENHLQFNISKCVSLSINQKFNTTYTIDLQPLPQLDSHRNLGVLLSTDLTLCTHLDHISSKAYKILGLLHRTFMNSYSTDAKKQLYIMLVRSHLLYCSQLRNICLLKDIIIWKEYKDVLLSIF